MSGIVAYAVFPLGIGEGSTPAGVVIDGAVYQLAGEPPIAPCGVGSFTGNGQR